MAKRAKSSQDPADLLSRHIEEIRETLAAFQPFLSRRKTTASLDGFDEQAEGFAERPRNSKPITMPSLVKRRFFRRRRRRPGRTMSTEKACINGSRCWKVVWLSLS